MKLEQLIPLIEAHQFAAEINLASGSSAFNRRLRDHALIRSLRDELRNSAHAKVLVTHLSEICTRPIDESYENPLDVAMAAYLTALDDVSSNFVSVAAKMVSDAPNCWWASKASARLLTEPTIKMNWMPLGTFVIAPRRLDIRSTAVGLESLSVRKPQDTVKNLNQQSVFAEATA